ncbi:hypothetical protein [Streptomyces sp. NBC_01750]|uniref:hypothetical protein n=1 Tax=Streptomyces sp. NBC_01750 TaxID=2975928 RepID=UPI002DD8B480|nr:hypothetical protein [Streptomyces sp. NBC_01750]WSD33871.1 hypothetical protein OG966_19425 [Streptomyces sp. NBC_01750]
MTDVSTEPVAAEPATPPPTPETTPRPHKAPEAAELGHTPGGWPVVPLATTGANSTIGLVATAALAGGPVAAAIAMTGAVVLGTAAAARAKRRDERRTGRKAAAPTGSRSASTAGGTRSQRRGGVPSQSRNGNAGTTKHRGSKPRTGTGAHARSPAGSSKHRQATRAARTANRHGTARPGSTGRVGQVRALRADKRQAAPTRAANRAQTTAARRGVADSHRAAKAAARSTHAPARGRMGRALAKGVGKVASGRNALVNKARAAKDLRTGQDVAGRRSAVRKAPARKRARGALWRSAVRMQGRRLVAALLGGALGIVGLFTTPLGRKLGIRWLQYPGRRLYRRLLGQARLERAERDAAIRQTQDAEEAAADADAESDSNEIKGQVERPTHLVPATPASPAFAEEAMHVSGFNFEETAAEMESAAHSYEPDGCMEILAMVEGLPAALLSVARTMQILAERSDSEFPMEKEVAGGLTDIYNALMYAVSAAEDLGPLFRQVHEQDIARHEDPRNGPEAEKGWNV